MKKFAMSVFVILFLGLLAYFGMQIYSSFYLPAALGQPDTTWVTDNGGELEVDEDGSIEGKLPLADGGEVEFDFVYSEQMGHGFEDVEEDAEPLFSAGMKLEGTNIVLRIESDNVGLSADKYAFRKAG